MNSAIEQRNGRTLVGTVVSDKCDKTIVVLVETLVQHPLLKKYIARKITLRCTKERLVAVTLWSTCL